MLTIQLKNVGNPDYRQDPTRRLPGVPNLTLRVATLAEAGTAARAYIEEHELGMGNFQGWIKKGRKVVAYLAYNGRAFNPEGLRRLTEEEERVIEEAR